MELLGYAVIAFAPGLFWLWFFVRGRTYRPKPRRLLVYAFVLGMLFTAPAAALEAALLWGTEIRVGASLAAAAAAMLFVVGPVEELSKFMAVRLGPYRSLYFDEPRDGLVYAVAASLGFASVENLVYILSFGPEVMVGRAPFSTLAHVIFGSFWGVGLGIRAQEGRRVRGLWLVGGLITAAAVHGVFNILLLTLSPLGLMLILLLTGLGLWWTLSRFRWAQRVSPFRLRRNYPKAVCADCGQLNSVASGFCQRCGLRAPGSNPILLVCSHCVSPVRPDASYCTRCGDMLLRR
jgi:RsiW-degrading membrane proteinase PrsW (M82 family)